MKTVKTKGVCATEISFKLDENNIIKEIKFHGGCDGNTMGLEKLLVGLPKDDVITKLKGIDCGGRGTSCPDQLANILENTK